MAPHRIRFSMKGFLQGGLLLLLGAGFCLFQSWPPIRNSLAQYSWPRIRAVVTKAHTSKSYSQLRTRVLYHFAYRYAVGGRAYTSRRYSFRYASGSPSEGVARFRAGDEIIIRYNPDNPSLAVVETVSAGFFVYAFFGLGILFLLMSAGMTFSEDPFAVLETLLSRTEKARRS